MVGGELENDEKDETTEDLDNNGDTFGNLEDSNQTIPCPVCNNEPKTPHLLTCLHPVCQSCSAQEGPIMCPRCRVTTVTTSAPLLPDYVHQRKGQAQDQRTGQVSPSQ